ncbi:MAG: alpha-galactosidase, partial [Clostridia bacterium]|nr:alpha-galactosidase [Clostridia bacterium]
ETLALPEIFVSESRNSVDFDAWKLHAYCLKHFPRKKMPVMYDTWLWCFDELHLDALTEQAKNAHDLGFEIFAIDAGWFGTGRDWYSGVGDWKENQTCAFAGKMREFSDFVHSLGMGFGVWMEPERARADSESVKNHPDFYLGEGGDRFLDFANPEAFDYILNMTSSLIETYRIDYMKYDFNATLPYDPSHASFIRYAQGRQNFYKSLRRKYPDLYMTRCGSGGYVMALSAMEAADSFWLSDNHGPTSMLRVYKDTAKRLLPCAIEKWNVQTVAPHVHPYAETLQHDMIVNCDDAAFTSVIRVSEDYALGMLSGSPFGFSCDLTVFPEDYKNKIRQAVAKFKAEREYYAGAVVKILADTENVTALQYENGRKSVIALFTGVIAQDTVTVFPQVDGEKSYRIAGEIRSGKDLAENGVCFPDLKRYGFCEKVLEEI